MKKILVLLLALVMVFSLVACKSKEQKAADKVLKKLENCLDDQEKAKDDSDIAEMTSVASEMMEIAVEAEEAYQDLLKVDEDAAQKFMEDVEDICAKFY